MDLIQRQAAIDALDCINGAEEVLRSLPSAQPEIIRCWECKYYQDNHGGYPHPDCKWDKDETPDEDDFCSFAERRE